MLVGRKLFRVELITPAGPLEPLPCSFAALPGIEGQVGVLANRAPLMCRLGSGLLRLEMRGVWRRYQIEGGVAHMLDNVLTVLTEQAEPVR